MDVGWSPSSETVAYADGSSIFVADAPDFAPREYALDVDADLIDVLRFTTGNYIVAEGWKTITPSPGPDTVGSYQQRLYLVSAWTGAVIELPEGAGLSSTSASPDGTKIAYSWHDPDSDAIRVVPKLGVYDLSNGKECVVEPAAPLWFRNGAPQWLVAPRWSPDGQYVLYSGSSHPGTGLLEHHMASVSECRDVEVTDPGGRVYWGDDGHRLTMGIQVDEPFTRYLATWDLATPPAPFVETNWRWPIEITPQLFSIAESDRREVAEFADRNGNRITVQFPEEVVGADAPAGYGFDFIVSPSGRYVVYHSYPRTFGPARNWRLYAVDTAEASWLVVAEGSLDVIAWVD